MIGHASMKDWWDKLHLFSFENHRMHKHWTCTVVSLRTYTLISIVAGIHTKNMVKPSVQLKRARPGNCSITVCSKMVLEFLDVVENCWELLPRSNREQSLTIYTIRNLTFYTWNMHWDGATLSTYGGSPLHPVMYVFHTSISNYAWCSIIDNLLYVQRFCNVIKQFFLLSP